MESSKIMMFPEVGNSGIDPALLMALNNNGGFGGANWMWIIFLWLIWGSNGWGNGNGNFQSQLNDTAGREMLMNAISGNGAAIQNLANLLNTEVSAVQNGIFTLNNAITSVGTQVGMSGLQIQNAIQSGNASLASQICQCCCNIQNQMAQNAAADQLAVCQQTNTLQTQAERNARDIVDAIQNQSIMINDKFCDLEKRELQDKINSLTADNALLRSNANNAAQTALINEKFAIVQKELSEIKASQPNTIPVQWPNIQAVNTTPYVNGVYGWWSNSFWN